jgi:hypothetical protein
MSISPEKPARVKPVAAFMAASEAVIEKAILFLESGYGSIDLSSPTFPFTHSGYYREEMGEGLVKRFCSFGPLVDPGDLVRLKLKAISCEKEFLVADSSRRTVNVDPGYLDTLKIVLATTKNSYHRMYLGHDVYGDIELMYRSGEFTCFEWTFPDYRDKLALEFFRKVREIYLAQLKCAER